MRVMRWGLGFAIVAMASCSSGSLGEGSSADSLTTGGDDDDGDDDEGVASSISMSGTGPTSSSSSTSSEPSSTSSPTTSDTDAETDTNGGECSGNDDCPDLDGDPCTEPRCDDNACNETAIECDPAGNQCAVGMCDPATGACVYEADDSICEASACTMGTCTLEVDGGGEFVSAMCSSVAMDGVDCDDDDSCTAADVCTSGICGGTALTCDQPPANGCNGTTLELYSAAGTCIEGDCDYELETIDCPDGCSAAMCAPPSSPVISEFLYDDNSVDSNVWIELWVPQGTDLATVSLEFVNGANGAVGSTLTLSGTTPADSLVLIIDPAADDATLLAEADFTDGFADLQNSPDSLRLLVGGTVTDAVAYGTFGAGETAAGEGTPAPAAGVDESLARRLTYLDTNDNAADFAVDSTPTPGSLND